MCKSWAVLVGIAISSWTLAVGGTCRAADGSDSTVAGLALKQADATVRNGLCLYLGATKSQSLAQLAAGSRLYVQAVVGERERAGRLRDELLSDANAARLSVSWRRTAHLPYLDDLVNLIVAEGWGAGDLKDLPLSEIVRVLQPGGVAVVGSDDGKDAAALLAAAGRIELARAEALSRKGAWIRIVKRMDPRYGEWPDTMGRPEQTRVAPDKVAGPGKEVRWVNGPTWSSYTSFHDIMAGGRDFHIESEWINPNLNQWVLVARDAHNGCDLWREKMGESVAADWRGTDRILCADEQRVYCNQNKKLVARDAATGKLVMDYGPAQNRVTSMGAWLIASSGVIDKQTGKLILPLPGSSPYHCHYAAGDGVVYNLRGDSVEAFQLPDGRSLWKVPFKDFEAFPNKADTRLMCRGDNVYLALGGNVVALDRANGKVRWTHKPDRPGVTCVMMALAEHVSLKYQIKAGKTSSMEQVLLDAKTGKQLSATQASSWIEGRCFPNCCTDRYVLVGDGRFIDQATGAITNTVGVRPSCVAGAIAAYGLVYNGPHYCSCLISLRGSLTYSPGSAIPNGAVTPQLLNSGVAPAAAPAGSNDWPIYRGDILRSDCYAGELPVQLKQRWSVKLGSTRIPQATAANGLVFVADTERQRVVALTLDTGREKWTFATEGRVSIAPTYYNGLCLFGDHAGQVYALDAATGKLVWQLFAAPEQKLMSAFNRFESAWPVQSGVLVLKDRACFVAGRCGAMDGGLYFYSVEPLTGKIVARMNFNDARPADVLISDGQQVILPVSREAQERQQPAAYNPDDNTNTPPLPRLRTAGTWYQMSVLNVLDSLDPGQTANRKRNFTMGNINNGYLLAFDKHRYFSSARTRGKNLAPTELGLGLVLGRGAAQWTNKEIKQQMQALLLAGSRLYGAAIPAYRDSAEKPALWVMSAADGSVLQKLPLESAPVIDGLSAADGRLLLTTVDGRIVCFGAP